MNKLMKTMLVIGACLLMACSALANQGPPVKITLLGDARGVQIGETFKGTLEIQMGATAELTDFNLGGSGWMVKNLDVSSQVVVNKDSRLEIPFEVEATRGSGPLFLEFRFGDTRVRKQLDLGLAHFERMTNAAETLEVSEVPVPQHNPGLQNVPALDSTETFRSGDQPDPEDEEIQQNRTINVNGRFVYQRSDGVTIGADGVTVRIYDEDVISDDLLATLSTDADGFYSVNIDTDDAGENNPDLYVHFESANSIVEVEDATWEINYTWETGTWDNFSGGTLNVGSRQPSDENEHPGLHIITNITRTWRWLLNHEGYNTPATDVQWPDGDSSAWYNSFFEEIHISTGRQWNEATHTHEYGHHWVNNYAESVTPDYCNGVCDFDGDCGHCIWCWETDHDAFAEGFPNWMADVLTRSYAGDYGIAPLNFRDQEDISYCSPGDWDDPYTTEGFLGALMRDIEDSGQDDHAHYPGFADALNLGTNEIFDVVNLDHSTTPAGFLEDFKDRFPAHKENLWETAKNCGYEIDFDNPDAATNLTSSSHTIGVDSPDPTISYTWTHAFDDASGIQGYGIYISSFASEPSTTMDIGDVSSYTTATLAPGSYYFNLRALDRAGNWSTTYSSYGPITIREPEPSDLTYYQPAGWDFPLVPRDDTAASTSDATVSTSLPGNSTGTYWNVRGINQGESGTSVGFQTRLYADEVYCSWASWSTVGAGVQFNGNNIGPVTVPGGRHSLEARYDATDQVAEEDETNNSWGWQFIWTPYQLTAGTPVVRAAPAPATAGWDAISGQSLWYNCDGLRTGSPGWWNAVTVRALDNDIDYDARLHPASTGAQDGFSSNLGYSSRPAGYLDAVIINYNVLPESVWDVGVLNNDNNTGSYEAHQVTSQGFSFGDSLTITLDDGEHLHLHEFYVNPDNVGFVSTTVDIDPDDGPVTVLLLTETFETGTLSSATAEAVTDDSTGRARLDFEIPDSGYNCLVIYRDPLHGSESLNYTMEIQTTPPDFLPFEAVGWHAPVVPRPADDGTSGLVALPDTLHGNVATTYLNFAARNESPSPSPDGLLVRANIDGVYRGWFSWGTFGAGNNGLFNWDYAWDIAGGRHTLDMRCDPLFSIEEIHEDNNNYGEQYVWSPLDVEVGTPVSRPAPPDRTGGWDEIDSGESIWFNCDGLRIPSRQSWWQAMAVMPAADSDVDVRLHDLFSGTKDGFKSNHVTSSWGQESSDFVLINYNVASNTGMDTGILNWDGNSGYAAENVISTYYGSNPNGTSANQSIESGAIMDLYEMHLNPDELPGGIFSVILDEIGGNVDWGLSLYGLNVEYQNKSDVVTDGSSWTGEAGQRELIEVLITEAGYYCLAVWKAKSDDLVKDGVYTLTFGNQVTAVEGHVPSVTQLTSIYPNPFNPQTTVVFDLASNTRTELSIYDLQGSLVRTLVSDTRNAGRYEVVWNGRDNGGRQVATGAYMACLKAGSVTQMQKLVLIK